jgi:hypothetical protein
MVTVILAVAAHCRTVQLTSPSEFFPDFKHQAQTLVMCNNKVPFTVMVRCPHRFAYPFVLSRAEAFSPFQ